MRTTYIITHVIGLLMLTGCQTVKPISMSADVTPTAPGIKNGDVLAPQRNAGQDIPQLRGYEMVTVRTYEYVKKPNSDFGTNTEIEGIGCELQSEGYRAAIKTPAEVRVPDYGYASRPLKVRCDAPGYKPAFASTVAYNKTTQQRMSSAGSGGLAGVVVVALINAASDEKKHDFSYHGINVRMNKLGCEKQSGGCR